MDIRTGPKASTGARVYAGDQMYAKRKRLRKIGIPNSRTRNRGPSSGSCDGCRRLGYKHKVRRIPQCRGNGSPSASGHDEVVLIARFKVHLAKWIFRRGDAQGLDDGERAEEFVKVAHG